MRYTGRAIDMPCRERGMRTLFLPAREVRAADEAALCGAKRSLADGGGRGATIGLGKVSVAGE